MNVDSNVKRISVGVESEVLLEPGCMWEFLGSEKTKTVENKKVTVYDVRVRRPESVPKGIPTFGACIIAKRKSKKWISIIHPRYMDAPDRKIQIGVWAPSQSTTPKGGNHRKECPKYANPNKLLHKCVYCFFWECAWM